LPAAPFVPAIPPSDAPPLPAEPPSRDEPVPELDPALDPWPAAPAFIIDESSGPPPWPLSSSC
jgi:hypothetical protein